MKPKLVMTLLVRNEEDILEDNICFHLNNGVDFIVATDNGSTDQTSSILKKYQRQGVLHYIFEGAQTYEQDKWVSRMAKIATEKYKATHLFHCDADEFWSTKKGSLKKWLPKGNEVFQVLRINYIPTSGKNSWDMFRYSVNKGKQEKFSQIGIEKATKRYLFLEMAPKIITTSAYTQISMGNHNVKTSTGINKVKADSVYIRHFPIRDFEQFEKKVKEGGEAYLNGPYADEPNIGWHWKAWYKAYKEGKLESLYQEITLQNKTEEYIGDGTIEKDRVPYGIKHAKKLYALRRKLKKILG